VFVCGGVFWLWLDPLGLPQLLENYSQDVMAMAMARCYRDGPGKCGEELANTTPAQDTDGCGRTHVSVVLLRDEDLGLAGEPWPPSYGFHASVLRAIRADEPRAVFIDIVFVDERPDPTITELRAELEEFRKKSIPVYAATFPNGLLRSKIRDLVEPVVVPVQSDPLDRVTRFYDLYKPRSDGSREPTAAFKVFREVCGDREEAPDVDKIRLFWAPLPDACWEASWNDSWLDCHRPAFLSWIIQNRENDFRYDCPFTPTIPVKFLLQPPESQDRIAKLLGNGIVIYGTYYQGAKDMISTPVQKELPGVFLHATALDNLMTLGAKRLSYSEHEIDHLGVAGPDVVALILVGFASACLRSCKRFPGWWNHLKKRFALMWLLELLVVLLPQLFLIMLVSTFACFFHAAHQVAGLGVNFLFTVAWTEILEITEKLIPAADEFGDSRE